jgi:trans-aconitate methyltransferase
MSNNQQGLWGAADSYERYMGRWSRRVAPLFLAWLQPRAEAYWIDIGCGTGGLTAAILAAHAPSSITAIDSSSSFLEVAASNISDDRVSFIPSDASSIPLADASGDFSVSGLVLNFMADKEAAMREMVRVVAPGGQVAIYVWDYAGHMQIMRHFFDLAAAFDPKASHFDDGLKAPICRPAPLKALLRQVGLQEVEVEAIDVPAAFESFDDYWQPFLGGTGSAPKYCASLDDQQRDRLKQALKARLPTGPDGEILLAVRAWAAKGRTDR